MKRRIQLMIDDKLYPKIKSMAGAEDIFISEFVERALREYVKSCEKNNGSKKEKK